MASTVLIVEDDPTTTELVAMYLKRDGYRVITAGDGVDGLRAARESKPDLVVLDLMLPKLSGMEVCRTLREESNVPIVMLTARVDEQDRLAGLDLGADDYVTKPFSPRELAARVRAVLRRTTRLAEERGPHEISVGGVTAYIRQHAVEVDGRTVRLTPTELNLLVTLMSEPGRVFSRESLISRVFGDDFEGFDRTVDTHISNLRKKVEFDPEKPKYINTVYGAGYRFGQ
ncbi:MAG: response regulator transcription factor [Dehalococcoidia bacterium]